MAEYLNISYVSFNELILRVGLAVLFGLIVGIDRERKNKPIDFRAYIIVAMTSCIIAILSQELYFNLGEDQNVVPIDLAKVIAGTLTGIGFLGAGAIIKIEGKEVVGTATGASIWAAGCIGLALGYGYYGLSAVAFLSVIAILMVGGLFRPRIKRKSGSCD